MSDLIRKFDRAILFRLRLQEAMAQRGVSQAALARAAHVDRSTISALLQGGKRLPNAQLAADLAQILGISCDWLLGLSNEPQLAQELLARSSLMTEAPRALMDDTLFAWHREAAGHKIRHVPASLPDMLKTAEVAEWEYAEQLGRSPAQAIRAFSEQLAWMQASGSEHEIAMPLHEIEAFATGTGYWQGLAEETRHAQLQRMAEICETLYPRLRLYLYDAKKVFSAPITVFGPKVAVIYLGQHYIAFRDAPRIAAMTEHFDLLVRAAEVSARALPELLRAKNATLERLQI